MRKLGTVSWDDPSKGMIGTGAHPFDKEINFPEIIELGNMESITKRVKICNIKGNIKSVRIKILTENMQGIVKVSTDEIYANRLNILNKGSCMSLPITVTVIEGVGGVKPKFTITAIDENGYVYATAETSIIIR